jgi:murein DD-endopeptidase MepM/ murein hydrolase activator NlpD
MMNEQLHIIITGDRGKIFRLPCSRKKLRFLITASILFLLFLIVTSIFSVSLFTRNRNYASQLSELKHQLELSEKTIAEHKKINETQRLKLNLQVANLELNNVKQAIAFKEEKDLLMSTAVSELNERSELIEKIMGTIGINLEKKKDSATGNSGGPFIARPDEARDDLLFKADKYLKTIRTIPLGKPVNGNITSLFGKRKDPVNHKKAFHTGIDFRGRRGDKVYATADGIVKKAFRNGGYGKYILIDHGNGYTTAFAHLQTMLVKKGERVTRGQLIGLVGNTGRSTGSHLHYEVCLDKKPINPYKFMKIASLLKKSSSAPSEKK